MNQRQAADELGYGTNAAVSYQLKKLRSEMQDDRKLQKRMKQIQKHIKNG
jgi:predicted transcriptional regulator